MYLKRSRITIIMALILSSLSMYSSIIGVVDDNLYKEVYNAGTIHYENIWGSVAQDIISILLSFILVILTIVFIMKQGYKCFISILGLTWYFLYAYGLYVIQGQYTSLYILYLIIFGLSLYSLIFGVLSFKPNITYNIPKLVNYGIIFYLGGTVLFLGPVWIIKLINDIAVHTPSRTYAVQIIDLCIIFPAFIIICIQLLKNKSIGVIMAGIAVIMGFTLCLSWAFSEFTGPTQGLHFNIEMALISGTLTLTGLALFIFYILNIKKV